jgi:hypothetical protein
MMNIGIKEMKIHLRERLPKRSNDPRQTSLTQGEDISE